jgi:hypothetical protein
MGSGYWYCTLAEHISFINERWSEKVSRELNLDIVHYEEFSHYGDKRPFFLVAHELAKNLAYRLSPKFFGWLRTIGFGNADVKSCPEIKHNPPSWISAKDHMIIIFRRN